MNLSAKTFHEPRYFSIPFSLSKLKLEIMDTLNLEPNKRYSYADYLTWMDDVRCELHYGFIKLITPAPSSKYQEIYQDHGVREYWIVSPNDENVTVFILDDKSKFRVTGMYAEDDKIPVNIFIRDLKVEITEVFTS